MRSRLLSYYEIVYGLQREIAAFSGIFIGFVEPARGWLLAIMQCALLISGYFILTKIPENGGKRELENFSLCGSVMLSFAGSFLGAYLKRAINQD